MTTKVAASLASFDGDKAWQLPDGGWQLPDGGWRFTDGGWQLDGGCLVVDDCWQ